MVPLTRLDGHEVLVNPDLILTAERTPDTLVCFTNGERLLVKEDLRELAARVLRHKQAVHRCAGLMPDGPESLDTSQGGSARVR